jgi:hypothetical protein
MSSKRPKGKVLGKRVAKTRFPGNDENPFGSTTGTVYKQFPDMMKWHPRIPKKELPLFLHDYWVVRCIVGDESTPESTALHFLYHCLFDSERDRELILPALRMGESISVFDPNKEEAISSLTFFETEQSAVVFFIGTTNEFQQHGMGSFMLSLLMQTLRSRSPFTNDINIYLLANEEDNPKTWEWYVNRDYMVLPGCPPFSPEMELSFSAADNASLKSYLAESHGHDLQWLHKRVLPDDFNKNFGKVYQRFYTNPHSTDCPSVYATLPGGLRVSEAEHCAPDLFDDDEPISKISKKAMNLFHHTTFSVFGTPRRRPLVPVRGNHLFTPRVSWMNRCYFRGGLTALPYEMLDFIIVWIQ